MPTVHKPWIIDVREHEVVADSEKMRKTLLFVHGTGVRGAAYAKTAALIRRQMQEHGLSEVEFAACLWGDRFGAQLGRGGKSIPTYGETRSPQQAIEDASPALWDLLLKDPTFELAMLANPEIQDNAQHGVDSRALDALLDKYGSLATNDDLYVDLSAMGLDHLVKPGTFNSELRDLVDDITGSDGFQRCARGPVAGQPVHRDALARALVAGIQKMELEDGMPMLDAPHRDELAMRIGSLLAANMPSVGSLVLAGLKGMMTSFATWQGRRRRSALSDAAYPAAGDILRYQLHGQQLREYVRERMEAYPDSEVYVLAHSLGGVATLETLIQHEIPNIKHLITFGSQAPFFYEIGALATLPLGDPLPSSVPFWSNFYDLNDPLSYVGAAIFEDRVEDYRIESGESFPASHSAYLHSKAFWTHVAALIKHV